MHSSCFWEMSNGQFKHKSLRNAKMPRIRYLSVMRAQTAVVPDLSSPLATWKIQLKK